MAKAQYMAPPAPATAAENPTFYNVLDAGVVADGTTNVANSITLLGAALWAAGGGTLYFPAGTYMLGATVTLFSNVEYVGDGRDATILIKNHGGTMLQSRGSASVSGHNTYFGVKDLTLNCNGTTGTAFEAMYADNIVMRDVKIEGAVGRALDLIEVWDSNFDNVVMDACGSTSVPNIHIRSSSAASGTGSGNDTSNVIRINNCRCESWLAGAIKIEKGPAAGAGAPNHIYINNFKAESSRLRSHAIELVESAHIELDKIYIYFLGFDSGFSTAKYGIYVTGTSQQLSLKNVHLGNSSGGGANFISGVYIWCSAKADLQNIFGIYSVAPTSGKHVELAGGGPYATHEPIQQVGATTSLFWANGVYRIPDRTSATPTIASAASLVVNEGLRVAWVSGTTTVTSIPATYPGHVISLIFVGAVTVTDGSNLVLSTNFVSTANDVLTLACDGTNWYEISRSGNN